MAARKKIYQPALSFKNRTTIYLRGQIEQQQKVLEIIKALLPTPLAEQVCHCVVSEQKLLVYTSSAVWASQLRFYSSTMLTATATLARVKVTMVQLRIINQQVGGVRQSERKARLPSPEKIAQLQSDSTHIEDEALRLSLLKLGDTLARLSRHSME